jgi:hypothetical protein
VVRDLGRRLAKRHRRVIEAIRLPVIDFWTYGVDIATMVTGLSALTAASVWTGGRWRAWRVHVAEEKRRVWNTGFIMMGVVQSWDVRLADDDTPDGRTGRVIPGSAA